MQLIAAGILFWSALLFELCWVGAWATFIWAGLVEHTFPLPDMLACAGFAALFVRLTAARRMRNIQVLVLHGICLTAFWAIELQRQQAHGAALALAAAAFWTSGALHARRELSHRVVCARFDFGMYWLLALLGSRLLLRNQVDVPQQAELTDALVPSFFANALCAICVARFRSQVSKRWLRVSGRIAMLFSGLLALAALGFSVTWICRPYLRSIAETTHTGAAIVARPIANAAAELIFAALREGSKHPVPVYLPGRMPTPWLGNRSWDDEVLEIAPINRNFLMTVAIIVGCMALLSAVVWLWWKRRWLLAVQNDDVPSADLRELWRRVIAWLRGLRANADAEPLRLMNALLIWGERSGVVRTDAETPLEYAARLKLTFAAVSGEIDSIVDNHCRQTYALRHCDERELQRARRALRELRSPRQWWARSVSRWRALHARAITE